MQLARSLLLALLLLVTGYIVGRTRSIPAPPALAVDDQPMQDLGLAGKRHDVRFERLPLDRALAELSRIYGVPIGYDSHTLQAGGIDPAGLFSYDGEQVELREALTHLSYDHRSAGIGLGYRLNGRRIILTTAEDAEQPVITRVYDVEMLLHVATYPNDNPLVPPTDPTSASFICFPPAIPSAPLGTDEERLAAQTDALRQFLSETVDAASWRDNGGQFGLIRTMGHRLIVTQTPENQSRVATLLNQLEDDVIQRSLKRQDLILRLKEADAAAAR